MTAVLLAAGLSTRLRPHTVDLPKPLVPVKGIPLLARALAALSSVGIQRVVIVTGFNHSLIQQFTLECATKPDPIFVHNPLYEHTSNNYSLALAEPHMKGEDMLLLDGDILFSAALLGVLVHASDPDALLVRTSGNLGEEEVKVRTDAAQKILEIGKQIEPALASGESVGLAKFSRATAQQLFVSLNARKSRHEFYEASFQEVINRGTILRAIPCGPHPCIEIDTPEDLAEAETIAATYGI